MEKNLIQGTTEWLEMRKKFVCASDAPILMEVSPFKRSDGLRKTPYVLWMEKLDLLPAETETAAMRYGKEMEETARQAYEKFVGDLVTPKVVFHKDIKYLMASLDGRSLDGKIAVEIKNANAEDHDLAGQNKIPDKYYPQLQQQMDCDDRDSIHYWSFHKGEGILVEVKKDEKYLEKLNEKQKEFWDCIINFKAPPLTSKDYVERDIDWHRQALSVLEIKQKLKGLKKEEKDAEENLREMSQNKNSSFGDLRYTCSARKGNVDYAQIPELHGIDLNVYRKPSSSIWNLSVRVTSGNPHPV